MGFKPLTSFWFILEVFHMKNLSKISSAIQWHDGMLIGPQHFQEAFFRSEDLIHYYAKNLSPYAYGITKIKVDDSAFTTGAFRIEEVEGIFPDGLEFCYDSKLDSDLIIKLADYSDELSKNVLTIFLSVPLRSDTNSISMDELSRYRESKAESAFDHNTGGEELEIPRIRPRLKLYISEIAPAHHSSIPIAKIFMDESVFRMSFFAPPMTKIVRGSILWDICISVSQKIRQKIQTVLDDLQRIRSLSQKQYYFDKYFTVHALIIALPRYEAALRSQSLNPFFLHLEMLSLLGSIYTIDQSTVPPVTVEYDHDNIYDGLDQIRTIIFQILDREIPTSFKIRHFTKVGDDFRYTLNEVILKGEVIVIGFRKPFNVKKEEFIEWIKSAIICNSASYELVRERRLLGFKRDIVDKYDELIPQRSVYLIVLNNTEQDFKEGDSITVAPSVQQSFKFSPDEVLLYRKIEES